MNLLLKQRLVGAAVIIALGVVIIPMLLDGSGSRIIQEIPERPARHSVSGAGMVKNQNIPTLTKRDESSFGSKRVGSKEAGDDIELEPVAKEKSPATTKSTASKTKPAAKAVVQKKKTAPEMASIKTPVKKKISGSSVTMAQASQKLASWAVQIGSFNEKGKAIKLRDQFRVKGFNVFMDPFKNADNASMYRVRVGPVQDRSQAETLLNQLKKKTGLTNGYVTQQP